MPGKIHVPVTVATEGFTKLQRTFSRLRGVTVGLTAAIAGLGAAARAVDFAGAAVQGARDLERNYAGLQSVFKENTEQMKAFGETASEMGLSMNEAAKATTFIGSVLKQSGFSIAETADLTEELVELGADLALTYGYDVQEALLGMTALFRGEYDPIEKFGVAMKQSEIDAEKAARGLDGLTGAAERFADQQIRVEFLMERAGDAMGAFERQSGNLTVQQMRLRAEFENVRDTVADDLLPPLANLTGGIRDIVQEAGPQLEKLFEDLAPVIEKVGRDALPLIQSAIETTIKFFDELIGFLAEAMDPTTDLNKSLTDAADSIQSLGERIGQNIPSMEEQFDLLAGAVGGLADALGLLAENIEIVFGPLLDLFASMEEQVRLGTLTAIAAGLVGIKVGLSGIASVFTKHPILAGLFFGTMALGQLGRQLEADANMTEKYKETVSDLNYELLENLTVQEEAAFSLLTTAKAKGELDEVLKEFPDLQPLAEKLGLLATTANTFTDETMKGQKAFIELDSVKLNGIEGRFRALFDRIHDVRGETALLIDGMTQLEQAQALLTPENVLEKGVTDQMRAAYKAFLKELDEDEDTGAAATDFVANFFSGIADGIAQEAARLDLEELGLSQALIDQILGSQGWEEVFQTIIDGGEEMARQLQDDFSKTAAGIAETQKAAEELAEAQQKIADDIADVNQRITDAQDNYLQSVKDARAEFAKFKDGLDLTVDALQTYEREIGKFESRTRSDLQRIESQVNNAFDNGYLLEEARDNLLEYARAEFQVLLELQQQRDSLLRKRNAAADVIFGVAQAITSAGNLTRLLGDVQEKVQEVQVSEVFEDIVQSADGLNGFKVTLERNYTEVVKETVNQSQQLVNNFQNVIDRTRNFIDNLKELRKLGLDPFLFNQLVEAGAEAGGATAQALVEGGADTVNEVNSLQRELESLGVELGEETYEVTKNSGEQFVSGIIDGMDNELQRLEDAATSMARSFSEAFSEALTGAMDVAFDGMLDEIRDEFEALMAELMDLLNSLLEEQQQVLNSVGYDSEGMPQVVITPEPPPRDMPGAGPIIVPDTPAPDFPARPQPGPPGFGGPGGFGGPMVFQTFVSANNPLDAYNASKGNVEQQSNFQSSNGNISVTLSGVGN